MPNLNYVSLIGNLTRDPELKTTQGGTPFATFGLAINRKFKVGEEQREETTFVDITFWGKAAETLEKYVNKGDPLYVSGRLHLEQWDDKQTGQKRSKLAVIGEEFQFLASKKSEDDAPTAKQRAQYASSTSRPAPARRPAPPRDPDLDPDDVPF